MYNRFLKYISTENLFGRHDKLLLGISGGVDSVTLLHLVNRLGNEFAIAHCNFNLRGTESDDDEQFVKNLAEENGIKCFVNSFATSDYALEHGISIEMAARKLRYDWFEKIRKQNHFDLIVVGHHLDDVLETFILNLSRGTGIRGLSGIKPKTGYIVRPLLFATRLEIEAYSEENGLAFRFDSSNDDVHIKRNKVRHKILPLLEELNPSFRNNLQRTIQNLNQTEAVFLNKIEEIRLQLVKEEGSWITIDKGKLALLSPVSIYLFELLRPFHFNAVTVENIAELLYGTPGNQFFSATNRLVIDREKLIITPLEAPVQELYYIEKDQEKVFDPIELSVTVEGHNAGYKIPDSKDIAVFDLEKVNFPLVIRKWQQGEYFCPLGMKGLKKLSDFFIDEKFSIPEKENAWVIASDNKIMWIVGHRIDDRFKVTRATKLILKMVIDAG
jgi:tRNA(Ile)-lysidine synthase